MSSAAAPGSVRLTSAFCLPSARWALWKTTLFLINFDFGEHDSLKDLERVTTKIREDIALLRPEPEVYVLSALFNLFTAKEKELRVKIVCALPSGRENWHLRNIPTGRANALKQPSVRNSAKNAMHCCSKVMRIASE
ncbi:MAG: hypothetical protein R2941_01300 [Desulfobacterales bacterium]